MKKYIGDILTLSIAIAAIIYIVTDPHPFKPKTVEPVIRAQDSVDFSLNIDTANLFYINSLPKKEVDSL